MFLPIRKIEFEISIWWGRSISRNHIIIQAFYQIQVVLSVKPKLICPLSGWCGSLWHLASIFSPTRSTLA